MKIAIQHTVELNEIPFEINKMIEDCAAQLTTISNIATAVDCMNPEKFASQVDFLRKRLFVVDNKLEECFSLMEGYQQTLKLVASKPTQTPENQNKDHEEIYEETRKKMEEMSQLTAGGQSPPEASGT